MAVFFSPHASKHAQFVHFLLEIGTSYDTLLAHKHAPIKIKGVKHEHKLILHLNLDLESNVALLC